MSDSDDDWGDIDIPETNMARLTLGSESSESVAPRLTLGSAAGSEPVGVTLGLDDEDDDDWGDLDLDAGGLTMKDALGATNAPTRSAAALPDGDEFGLDLEVFDEDGAAAGGAAGGGGEGGMLQLRMRGDPYPDPNPNPNHPIANPSPKALTGAR
mmetsp:Transcript_46456/g.145368  ORF Transcript_46456/g.145368 Transcript_46456/m.145368 type:complete len:155 (-) Transcript_46456:1178-1642(-)